jgi:hypothetical protein
MPTLTILNPTLEATLPATFTAYGCYEYDQHELREKDAHASVAKTASPRHIEAELFKGSTSIEKIALVPRTACINTRWEARFGATHSLAGGWDYKLIVSLYETDTAAAVKTVERSPFAIDPLLLSQTPPFFCNCATASVGKSSAQIADSKKGCCEPCGSPEEKYPVTFDFLSRYKFGIAVALCIVYDTTPFGHGIVSFTRGELSLGRCAAQVPLPPDFASVPYAAKFLLMDHGEKHVLLQSPPIPLQ